MRSLLLGLAAFCYGLTSAAGVFTSLAAVGLVPRFTGKTHTAKYTMLYENVVCLGTMVGCYFSVFCRYGQIGSFFLKQSLIPKKLWEVVGTGLQGIYGIFSGMFVGCLALAIAEMLDSIPIFARRIRFKRGLGFAILGVAVGKLMGSLLYFGFLKR